MAAVAHLRPEWVHVLQGHSAAAKHHRHLAAAVACIQGWLAEVTVLCMLTLSQVTKAYVSAAVSLRMIICMATVQKLACSGTVVLLVYYLLLLAACLTTAVQQLPTSDECSDTNPAHSAVQLQALLHQHVRC
jgi:SNF family Na+-dependent transporter